MEDDSAKSKVLAIGDQKTEIETEKPVVKFHKLIFNGECTNHLTQLLMESQTPVDVAYDWRTMEWFGMESIKTENRPTRYQFYCHRTRNYPPSYIIYCHTINANAIMHEVRKGLKEENWISKYVLEGPLKAEIGREYDYSELNYIQTVISKAFDAEMKKLFYFVLRLHKEHLKKNAKT